MRLTWMMRLQVRMTTRLKVVMAVWKEGMEMTIQVFLMLQITMTTMMMETTVTCSSECDEHTCTNTCTVLGMSRALDLGGGSSCFLSVIVVCTSMLTAHS